MACCHKSGGQFWTPITPQGVNLPRRSTPRLTDNGSIYAAANTVGMAVALNLVACFTPVQSPESNGIAETFVKTFKRDYVWINPIPDAPTALAAIEHWFDDYNEVHPHSSLAY